MEAVIFDFAGVIASDSFWDWAGERIPNLEEHRAELGQLSARLDIGELPFQDFTRRLGEMAMIPASQVQPEILSRTVVNIGLLPMISALKVGQKIGLLSNGSGEHVRRILTDHQLEPLFHKIQISSECRLVKPDPAAFLRILEELDVAAANSLFIDDREVHVEAASKLGMKALLFTTNAQLARDLATVPGLAW